MEITALILLGLILVTLINISRKLQDINKELEYTRTDIADYVQARGNANICEKLEEIKDILKK